MTPPSLPPPLPPVPFAAVVEPPSAEVDPRPTSVRLLCILGVVFGFGALMAPFTSASLLLSKRPAAAATPTAVSMQRELFSDQLLPWTLGVYVVSVVLAAWLIAASIAAWRLRPAGRQAMLAYAVTAIVCSLASGVINALVLMPAYFAPMARPPMDLPPGVVYAGAVAFGVFFGLVGMIYPICVLIFFRRRNVIAAFARVADQRSIASN